MPSFFRCFLILILTGVASAHPQDQIACAMERDVPFVVSHERFGKRGSIESSLDGQLLVSELGCFACHESAVTSSMLGDGPRGPNLDDAATRLSPEWIASMLASPSALMPHTRMPDVFATVAPHERDREIQALVAFLMSQDRQYPELKASGRYVVPLEYWKRGDVDRGREAFHRVGCVACHAPDQAFEVQRFEDDQRLRLLSELDPEELEELGLADELTPIPSIPLGDVKQKYVLRSLTEFLLRPEQHRPSTRMPNFSLQPMEAADLAAYLLAREDLSSTTVSLDQSTSDWLVRPADFAAYGREVFVRRGCASCHAVKGLGESEPLVASPWNEIDLQSPESCIQQPDATGRWHPLYRLSDSQRNAINVMASISTSTVGQPQAAPALLQWNCVACHQRHGIGGVGVNRKAFFETVGNVDLGDEGRLAPSLDHVGAKLTSTAIKQTLQGKSRVRPHMTLRMPVFSSKTTGLLTGLLVSADAATRRGMEKDAEAHGWKGLVRTKEREVAAAGRTLMNVGCIQCHMFNGASLPGVVGVDLASVTGRLHPSWFRSFLLSPQNWKERTRMPSFFENGKSQKPDVLAGDVERQLASMWLYLSDIEKHALPQKIEEALMRDTELRPLDRPVLIRTFMAHAGTRAIAIGLPGGTHLAYDAEVGNLATLWRGRFLDAAGTWYSRLAPPAEPLGQNVTHLEKMSLISSDDVVFDGYRIAKDGAPEFQLSAGGWRVTDAYRSSASGGIERRIVVKGPADHLEVPGPTDDMPVLTLNLLPHHWSANQNGVWSSEVSTTAQVGPPWVDVCERADGEHGPWQVRLSLGELDEGYATVTLFYEISE
ncbi:MAG: cytochrome c [Planctomycetota bacterium]